MKICYAHEHIDDSIFLAGPTPRSNEVVSWRIEALEWLEELQFKGTVYVPEPRDGRWYKNYDGQVLWEWSALNAAKVVAFWIPRELEHMPGFTTNVEFGSMVYTNKCVLGYPNDAPKTRYLQLLGKRYNIEVFHTLLDLMEFACKKCEDH